MKESTREGRRRGVWEREGRDRNGRKKERDEKGTKR